MLLINLIVGHAQSSKGNLTIISEDNHAFYLYLNGIQYNQHPALAVRVEQIASKTVNCRIVYPHSRLTDIIHQNLAIADDSGYMQDITFTVSSNKGKKGFSVYHVIPLEPIQINQDDIQMYRFNQPKIITKME